MRGFWERMNWKMEKWMQGRHGQDELSRFLTIGALVLFLFSFCKRDVCSVWSCCPDLGPISLLLPKAGKARAGAAVLPKYDRQAPKMVVPAKTQVGRAQDSSVLQMQEMQDGSAGPKGERENCHYMPQMPNNQHSQDLIQGRFNVRIYSTCGRFPVQ